MVGDPHRVFREETESKRETLKLLWPDLYDALAQLDQPRPAWNCTLHGPNVNGGPVVGRLWRNGPPACKPCCDRVSDKPGGYPLELS